MTFRPPGCGIGKGERVKARPGEPAGSAASYTVEVRAMCREGIDLVTLKVALKHGSERLEREADHLRQWAALASNANLEDVSRRINGALEQVMAGREMLSACVRELAALQVGGTTTGGGGFTVTPL